MVSNYLPFLLLIGAAMGQSTTTIDTTITPTVTFTTTVDLIEQVYETEYIYTDDTGHLTTSIVIGSTAYVSPEALDTSTSSSSSSSSPSSSSISSDAIVSATTAVQSNSDNTSSSIASASDIATNSQILDVNSSTFSNTKSLEVSVSKTSTVASATDNIKDPTEVAQLVSQSPIPEGDYSTSHSTATEIIDGTSMVVEYVILHTSAC